MSGWVGVGEHVLIGLSLTKDTLRTQFGNVGLIITVFSIPGTGFDINGLSAEDEEQKMMDKIRNHPLYDYYYYYL